MSAALRTNSLFFIQIIHREWQASLTLPQLSVLLFIYDRTIGWGKAAEIVTIDQLVNGIPRLLDNGKPVHRGTGLGRTTAKQALSGLIHLGAVERSPSGRTGRYSINKEWKPIQPLRNRKSRGLVAASEKLMQASDAHSRGNVAPEESYCEPPVNGVTVNGSTSDPHGSASNPSWVKLRPLRKNSQENTLEDKTTAAPAEPACGSDVLSLDEAIAGAQARVDAGIAHKVARATAFPTPARLEEIWRSSMLEHFPDQALVNWTPKERGMVRYGLVKQVAFNGTQFVEFLQWIVAEWDLIVHAHFHWLKEPAPIRPAISFIVGLRTHFLTAYAFRARLLSEAKLSFDDRQMIALTRQGYSKEEAAGMVEERKAGGRAKMALDEKRRDAERIIRISQRMQRGIPAVPLSPERRATTFIRTPLPEVN